jgi:hypothetical protein
MLSGIIETVGTKAMPSADEGEVELPAYIHRPFSPLSKESRRMPSRSLVYHSSVLSA